MDPCIQAIAMVRRDVAEKTDNDAQCKLWEREEEGWMRAKGQWKPMERSEGLL